MWSWYFGVLKPVLVLTSISNHTLNTMVQVQKWWKNISKIEKNKKYFFSALEIIVPVKQCVHKEKFWHLLVFSKQSKKNFPIFQKSDHFGDGGCILYSTVFTGNLDVHWFWRMKLGIFLICARLWGVVTSRVLIRFGCSDPRLKASEPIRWFPGSFDPVQSGIIALEIQTWRWISSKSTQIHSHHPNIRGYAVSNCLLERRRRRENLDILRGLSL